MTVRPGFFLLFPQHRLARSDDLLFVGKGLLGMFSSKEVEVGLANCLGRVIEPKCSCERPIDVGETAFEILEVDDIGEIVHEGAEQMPLLQELRFRLLAPRDVAGDAKGPDDLSVDVTQGHLRR